MLLDYFNRTYVISLPHHSDRRKRLFRCLRGAVSPNRMEVFEAIHGDSLPAPAYWRQGNGSWGCLCSHVRLLQEIWQKGYERALILEDDTIISPALIDRTRQFFEEAPTDWGQMYLGGQHQAEPTICDGYMIGNSVNRTHAYAVQRHAIPAILQHIQHAPDYIAHPWRHVDHQMEVAHQRKTWKVVCPEWWLFGQGENQSAINGNFHPDKWWDWASWETVEDLPWVIVPPDITDAAFARIRKHIHLGWHCDETGRYDSGVQAGLRRRSRAGLKRSAKSIAEEAYAMRRLPAFAPKDQAQLEIFKREVNPAIVSLTEARKFDTIQWSEER